MATRGVIVALIKQAKHGKELTDHRRFTLATNVKVYFCDPQSPWQRGSNENTNRLLRQYFPKGTGQHFSQAGVTLTRLLRCFFMERANERGTFYAAF